METKLCRICGKLGQNYVNIFRTEGLKNKIETCLPIIVSPHSLLPDTICGECSDNVDNFYSFIKNCLQNIIILEAQYDINESCLKTKRKHDKGCTTDLARKSDKNTQTIDYLDLLLKENELNFPNLKKLVDYDDSDSEQDVKKAASIFDNFGRKYFDDAENYLIDEITQRKKRKNEDTIESSRAKICKIETTNRRKNKQPKKLEIKNDFLGDLPQVCLLCDEQFTGPSMLASHVFETHGIDMAAVTGDTNDKKKKLPNLLKISDLRKSDSIEEEEPPTLLPSFVCSLCPAMFTSRPDLFGHLRVKHSDQSALLCGMCLYQASSLANLQSHVELCSHQHPTTTKYVCQVCRYGDDNSKSLENHILVHDFLLDACKKQSKMFDPADYIETNGNYESGGSSPMTKSLACSECGMDDFDNFKEFSTHRRSQHSIFHCDLCNKFYGRNSHLWKHVNRLHKGHPSITCQLCYKTSASKYHLAQHFNKIHSTKSCKKSENQLNFDNTDDFMSQKFQAFDFQSVKQSFMRQELLEQQEKKFSENDDNSNNHLSDQEPPSAPKEIDSSSDLYTNIITNYTPPANEGEFKCPKCGKGFHKKTLLKKHKKNCRPRLQKDLLTRCKSCARIFKDRQSLAKHLVNYHSEYACEICGQKVQSKCEIVSHIRFTHPGCHLFCTICGNILRSRNDMADHTRDHMNSYVCQFCADALPSKIKLKMHILSLHRKILSLSCGVCLKLFETQHVLRDHVRLVHRDQLAPLTSCPVCGKNYGSKWKTYDHLNKSHGRIFKACKACLEVFDNENQLQAHYDSVHGGGKNNIPVVTSQVSQPQNHCESESERETNSEQSDEQEEDEQYDNKISLLEKRLLGKNEKVLPTKINNKKLKELDFDTNPQHNSSKRTVYVNSNDPSFCEICHKTWPAKKHLWQHYIRCHKSVAATVCGICLKTNSSYGALQAHLMETHPTLLHGQGFGSNFICRICGRYHNASSKLKLHMAIHENFDWSMLEQPKEEKKEENGFQDASEINYESLIEQVECSSGSESENVETKDKESSSEDDSDSETNEASSVSEEEESSGSWFMVKSEESEEEKLESAIRSIKYECVEKVEEEVEEEYCDMQAQSLNDNEIESAVGSIL
ncbi:zinc finger protein 729 isoform X1 [Tribolium castaneum]|uniref:Uncharacterized protein n=1 Tax=Tribolium castaneum TaxID=7070 RepID=D2A4K6_TRICA|nr:PREDICTED: zinc finger protein 729 isoform X1 [Tribolium castaneum]EFA05208.1 hypothetical protein TcasGA2_TC015347 [Tribolium castaneum]|eukprot:XP_008194472.1 PREDICTED: zinc finger protein 729 isoform X1 [Tribolium castaneum]